VLLNCAKFPLPNSQFRFIELSIKHLRLYYFVPGKLWTVSETERQTESGCINNWMHSSIQLSLGFSSAPRVFFSIPLLTQPPVAKTEVRTTQPVYEMALFESINKSRLWNMRMGREKRFFRPHFIERDSRHVALNDVSMSVPPPLQYPEIQGFNLPQ